MKLIDFVHWIETNSLTFLSRNEKKNGKKWTCASRRKIQKYLSSLAVNVCIVYTINVRKLMAGIGLSPRAHINNFVFLCFQFFSFFGFRFVPLSKLYNIFMSSANWPTHSHRSTCSTYFFCPLFLLFVCWSYKSDNKQTRAKKHILLRCITFIVGQHSSRAERPLCVCVRTHDTHSNLVPSADTNDDYTTQQSHQFWLERIGVSISQTDDTDQNTTNRPEKTKTKVEQMTTTTKIDSFAFCRRTDDWQGGKSCLFLLTFCLFTRTMSGINKRLCCPYGVERTLLGPQRTMTVAVVPIYLHKSADCISLWMTQLINFSISQQTKRNKKDRKKSNILSLNELRLHHLFIRLLPPPGVRCLPSSSYRLL